MGKRRHAAVILSSICVFCVLFGAAQEVAHENTAKTDLRLVAVGDGWGDIGNKTASRVFEAPDGTKGQVVYTKFDSLQAAQQQIERWLKPTRAVTSRQKNQRTNGQMVSDRILAEAESPKSDRKEFVIIRRDDLTCYLIESTSLQVALQVEALIEHK